MRTRSLLRPGALAAAALSLLGAHPAVAQQTPAPGVYVIRLGADTAAVEEFTRTAEGIRGRHVVRTPRTQVYEYAGTLTPEGTLSRFEVALRTPGEAQPTARAVYEFGADSATVRLTRGDSTRTSRVAAPAGSLPFLGYSVGLYEIPLARAAGPAPDSMAATLVPLAANSTFPLTVRRVRGDTFAVANIAGESRAVVGEGGRLLRWDGTETTLKITAERAEGVSVDSLIARFAARDRAGQGMGSFSPRDTVTARVGAATVSVDYGRPSMRGRRVFGSVVPWGEVWRTGANQATHLRTDADLVIGGVPVPAGSYTLWTVPGQREWTLVLNRQTGQWGTQYDRDQDLARIPMRVERLPRPVETFTISLEPQGEGGMLAMEWENTRATVPVQPASR